jgi:hypothetical protein
VEVVLLEVVVVVGSTVVEVVLEVDVVVDVVVVLEVDVVVNVVVDVVVVDVVVVVATPPLNATPSSPPVVTRVLSCEVTGMPIRTLAAIGMVSVPTRVHVAPSGEA